MNQADSERVKEAKRKRQGYLRKKAISMAAIVVMGMGTAVTGFACLITLWLIGLTHCGQIVGEAAAWTLCGITVLSSSPTTRAITEFKRISYVPPVREQIATLSANEVLLRSSDQPAATSDELLRSAQVSTETTSEELLRAESRSNEPAS